MKEKIDAPEDVICIQYNLLHLDQEDGDGWTVDFDKKEHEKYILDATYSAFSETGGRNRTLTPYPGREDRVRRWIAKGRLMNPNFPFVFAGHYMDDGEEI